MSGLTTINPSDDWNALLTFSQEACRAMLIPEHLRGKAADFLLVAMQAKRWGFDPFSLAQCTSVHQGKLMYEGKVVHAALLNTGMLARPFRYDYKGEGENMECTITGEMNLPGGTTETHSLTIKVRDVRTIGMTRDGKAFKNAWDKQPRMQLAYRGARDWARLYAPGVMLGVVTDDERIPSDEPSERDGGKLTSVDKLQAIQAKRAEAEKPSEPAQPIEATVEPPEVDEGLMDMLTVINDSTDAAELMLRIEEKNAAYQKDSPQEKTAGRAIMSRARVLGLEWRGNAFVDKQEGAP